MQQTTRNDSILAETEEKAKRKSKNSTLQEGRTCTNNNYNGKLFRALKNGEMTEKAVSKTGAKFYRKVS